MTDIYFSLTEGQIFGRETSDEAISFAMLESKNQHGKRTAIYKAAVIGYVYPPSEPRYELSQPAPAPAPDTYKVGERVEAIYDAHDAQQCIKDGDWRPAEIIRHSPSERVRYMVRFDDRKELGMYDYQVRRPVPAAASAPAAVAREPFKFGEQVTVKGWPCRPAVFVRYSRRTTDKAEVIFSDRVVTETVEISEVSRIE